MMPKITLFTLATAALLCGVSAYDTFVGCRNAPMSVIIQGSAAKVDTTALCALHCKSTYPTAPELYSQFGDLRGPNCVCAYELPTFRILELSRSVAAPEDCAVFSHFSIFRIRTSFTLDGCYSAPPDGATTRTLSENCFVTCGSSAAVTVFRIGDHRVMDASNVPQCGCYPSSLSAPLTRVTCSMYTAFRFIRSDGANPSPATSTPEQPFGSTCIASCAQKRQEVRDQRQYEFDTDYLPKWSDLSRGANQIHKSMEDGNATGTMHSST